MHGRSYMASRFKRLTIVPESNNFGVSPKKPMISRAPLFDGFTVGIVRTQIFFLHIFQYLNCLADNRVGVGETAAIAEFRREFSPSNELLSCPFLTRLGADQASSICPDIPDQVKAPQ